MKTFKVTVDNQSYTVKVEELTENYGGSPAVKQADPAPQVAPEKPAPVDKPAVPVVEKPQTSSSGGYTLKAPMPGSVLEVRVSEGAGIKEGDVLLVLEAMKMENELTASEPGTVSQIHVKKGDTVNSGDPLITLS